MDVRSILCEYDVVGRSIYEIVVIFEELMLDEVWDYEMLGF